MKRITLACYYSSLIIGIPLVIGSAILYHYASIPLAIALAGYFTGLATIIAGHLVCTYLQNWANQKHMQQLASRLVDAPLDSMDSINTIYRIEQKLEKQPLDHQMVHSYIRIAYQSMLHVKEIVIQEDSASDYNIDIHNTVELLKRHVDFLHDTYGLADVEALAYNDDLAIDELAHDLRGGKLF